MRIYSAADAAEALGVSHAMVRTLLQSGRLRGRKLGNGAWVIDEAALDAFSDTPRRRAKGRLSIGQLQAARRR